MASATITHEDMTRRVAARFLRAEDQGQQQAPAGPPAQQGQMEQQALPKSDVGKGIVKGALDKVNAAFESGDEASFHKELDGLLKAAKHGGI